MNGAALKRRSKLYTILRLEGVANPLQIPNLVTFLVPPQPSISMIKSSALDFLE